MKELIREAMFQFFNNSRNLEGNSYFRPVTALDLETGEPAMIHWCVDAQFDPEKLAAAIEFAFSREAKADYNAARLD